MWFLLLCICVHVCFRRSISCACTTVSVMNHVQIHPSTRFPPPGWGPGPAAMQYVARQCARFKYLLKSDDDTFVSIPRLIAFLGTMPATRCRTGLRPTAGGLPFVWGPLGAVRSPAWPLTRGPRSSQLAQAVAVNAFSPVPRSNCCRPHTARSIKLQGCTGTSETLRVWGGGAI